VGSYTVGNGDVRDWSIVVAGCLIIQKNVSPGLNLGRGGMRV